MAAQIKRFLNDVRQHNLRRLRRLREQQQQQQASQREPDVTTAAVDLASLPVRPSTSGGSSGGSPRGGNTSDGGSEGARRRRHIVLEFEGAHDSSAQRKSPPTPQTAQLQAQLHGSPAPPQDAPPALARAAGAAAPPLLVQSVSVEQMRLKEQERAAREAAAAATAPIPSDEELLSLEWLRDVPDDEMRAHLMGIDGEAGGVRGHVALPCRCQRRPAAGLHPPPRRPLQAWAARAWPASCC